MTIEPSDFDLVPWMGSIRSSYSPLAKAKGLILEVEAPTEDLGWVHGDPVRIRQILTNYLSNALKFTLSGSITLRFMRLGAKRVRFEVCDTGLGIPAAQLHRLFQPYAQAGSAPSGVRSSGLGLSICRLLAERMDGTTGALSEQGMGSCFWLELDLPAVAAPRAVAAVPEADECLQGLRLLVVDDNRINLVVARRLLERAGARVEVADGGRAALQAVDDAVSDGDPYDLVVMDIQMPDMNGIETLAAMRRSAHGATLPVLAASAAVTAEEVATAREAGFDGFVSKPLNVVDLLQAVVEACGQRAALTRF